MEASHIVDEKIQAIKGIVMEWSTILLSSVHSNDDIDRVVSSEPRRAAIPYSQMPLSSPRPFLQNAQNKTETQT